MGKQIQIDFSSFDENELGEKHWTPPSHNYFGSHGYNETKLAIVNYLNIGDVGDPEWRDARRLPFGDEALEAFYPGSRGISFIQYPWEHPDADDVDENPVTRMISSDPTLEWALKEMEKLEQGSDKYNELSDLVSEIRGYAASQVEEEAFVHAPSWAMDSLIYAQERSNDPEITKIVEDFAPRKSMRGKVISTAMYPDTRALKSIANIHDEYEVKVPGFKQYCFALKNGKKVFGPYGDSYGAMKFYRGENSEFEGAREFKQEQMFKVLNELGIIPTFDEDGELLSINHFNITPENLLEAKANYSQLASVIQDANTITSFVMAHIRSLQEDLYWDKLSNYLKKTRSYDDVMEWSADLNKEKTRAKSLRTIGHIGLGELIDDYDELKSKIYTKINTNYYVLNVGKNNQVTITDSKDLADAFKTGNSHDVLYFLLDSKSQKKLEPLSVITDTYGYESEEYKDWVTAATKALSGKYSKYSEESIQRIISQYNSERKVKTIRSRTMREYGWLLNELPFNRSQINILNDCLEAYGRAIVAAQQQVPVIRQIFGRLKSVVERDVSLGTVPKSVIDSIAEKKTASFVYKIRHKNIPTGREREDLISAGLISQEEIRVGKYLDIELHYEYTFTNPSDVFRYVSNFAVTPATIRAAMSN